MNKSHNQLLLNKTKKRYYVLNIFTIIVMYIFIFKIVFCLNDWKNDGTIQQEESSR